jgi:hypothetical protein
MAKGMSKASDFVLSGGSAGGLSTFLHADRVAARLRAEAPSGKKIRAAPIVGYFLDHDNFKHTTGLPGGPNSPQWATPGTGATYTTWMKWLLRNIAVSFAEFFIVNNKITQYHLFSQNSVVHEQVRLHDAEYELRCRRGADQGLPTEVSDRAWPLLHVAPHAGVHRDAVLYVQ